MFHLPSVCNHFILLNFIELALWFWKKLQEYVRKWYNIIEKLFEKKKVCRYVIDVEYCLVKYLNCYEISTRFMDMKGTKFCESHCNYQLNGSYEESPLRPL